jgi:hypothetical protein
MSVVFQIRERPSMSLKVKKEVGLQIKTPSPYVILPLNSVDGRNSPSVNWKSGTGPGLSK